MFKLVTFAVLSACLIYISRASLETPRSHGFYRFFAWEFILALILLNLDRWFQEPFSAHQIISWLLLVGSTVLVAHGAYLLRIVGRPDNKRSQDAPLIGIEKTTSLVTVGAYKYIRHPIYSSLLFLAWGVFFKDPSWLGIIIALAATTFLVITAKVEEAECIRCFGPSYQAYMKQTRMFVPFLC
jgi:protein-S-isoprenylcysteine O-methyltransferase Ste14